MYLGEAEEIEMLFRAEARGIFHDIVWHGELFACDREQWCWKFGHDPRDVDELLVRIQAFIDGFYELYEQDGPVAQ